jgi:hypothetical protein
MYFNLANIAYFPHIGKVSGAHGMVEFSRA